MSRRRRYKMYRRWAVHGMAHLALIASGFVFMVPFFWMLSTSLKPDTQIFVHPPIWIPDPFKWENFVEAWNFAPFGRYFANTFFISISNVIGILISCSLTAYGLSILRWRGRNVMLILVLSTMMMPYQVTLIPLFIVFRTLGWIDTFYPLIVPAFFGAPFFVFLLRQFFLTIPRELRDAARIDGASEFVIYLRIVMPLAKPALATVALFTFIANWQDFLGPLIYLSSDDMATLSIGLRRFLGVHTTEWALLMAASTMVTMPVIILFFLTQKTFISGIALTGIKG